MLKQLLLVAGIVGSGLLMQGCRVAAPVLEDMGGSSPGCSTCNDCDTKTKMMIRQQARSARNVEEFVDTYFFNYNVHDPYRGDYRVLDGNCCR